MCLPAPGSVSHCWDSFWNSMGDGAKSCREVGKMFSFLNNTPKIFLVLPRCALPFMEENGKDKDLIGSTIKECQNIFNAFLCNF